MLAPEVAGLAPLAALTFAGRLGNCGEVAQSCPTLSDPMVCSLPGSSVHGIFQARVLEWGAIAFSEGQQLNVQRGGNSNLADASRDDPQVAL